MNYYGPGMPWVSNRKYSQSYRPNVLLKLANQQDLNIEKPLQIPYKGDLESSSQNVTHEDISQSGNISQTGNIPLMQSNAAAQGTLKQTVITTTGTTGHIEAYYRMKQVRYEADKNSSNLPKITMIDTT